MQAYKIEHALTDENMEAYFHESRKLDHLDQIKYGNKNEDKALTTFSMKEGFTVLAVGLVVPDKYWFLGVSPDGLIWNEERSGFGIVEVKCIASCEDKKIVHVKQLDYQGELVKANYCK